jgi:hypothetical protein
MRQTIDELRGRPLYSRLGFYALYAVLIVVALIVGLVIWRQALFFVFYSWIDFGSWARLLYMVTVVGISIGMVAGLLAAEPYLETGRRHGRLMPRFLKALGVTAVLGLLGWFILVVGRGSL